MRTIILIIMAWLLVGCYLPPETVTKNCKLKWNYRGGSHRTKRNVKICTYCDGYTCWKEVHQLNR